MLGFFKEAVLIIGFALKVTDSLLTTLSNISEPCKEKVDYLITKTSAYMKSQPK